MSELYRRMSWTNYLFFFSFSLFILSWSLSNQFFEQPHLHPSTPQRLILWRSDQCSPNCWSIDQFTVLILLYLSKVLNTMVTSYSFKYICYLWLQEFLFTCFRLYLNSHSSIFFDTFSSYLKPLNVPGPRLEFFSFYLLQFSRWYHSKSWFEIPKCWSYYFFFSFYIFSECQIEVPTWHFHLDV